MVVVYSKRIENTNIFRGDVKKIVDYFNSKDVYVEVYHSNNGTKRISNTIGEGGDKIEYEFDFNNDTLNNFSVREFHSQDYSSKIFNTMAEFEEFKDFFDEYLKVQKEIDKLKSALYSCRDIFGIKLRTDEAYTYEDE